MKQIIYLVARYLQYIAAADLLVLMLLQVANMSGRLFFGSPIKGTTDLGSYMLLVIAALGFGWAALESRLIKVTLVTDRRLPAKVQYYLELVILSIIFVVVVISLTYMPGPLSPGLRAVHLFLTSHSLRSDSSWPEVSAC